MTKDPVALVTGSGGGIGRRLTGALAEEGYRVLATDLDPDALGEQAARLGWSGEAVLCRRQDVTDRQAWREMVEFALATWGRLDLLCNVAGYTRPAYLHESTVEELDRHLDVNARGVILGTRAACAPMMRQGSGHIVNFASLAGIAAAPGLTAYSASKSAVRGFSHGAAQELRRHGIAVTVVCTDAVDTPMLERQIDYPEAALSFTRVPPLSVDEVVRAVLGRVLRKRPIEIAIPRLRGWQARFASVFPSVAARFSDRYVAKGRARQEVLRRERDARTRGDG